VSGDQALERLGRRVAEHQDREGPTLDVEQGLAGVRQRLARPPVDPPDASHPWRRWVVAPALAAAVAVLLVLVWPRSPVTFAIDGAPAQQLGEWTEAEQPTTVRFSDGTEVHADVGSRWRVREVRPGGATLQLERGQLTADVRSTDDCRWEIEAGPYQIRVTGTQFTTSWDPVGETFALRMVEGVVELSGPIVGGRRTVRAPEQLRIGVRKRTLSTEEGDPSPAQPATTQPSAVPEPPATVASATATPERPAWVELAQQGKHAEALALLRAQDLDAVLGSESPAGLMQLAHTARLGGDPALAGRALATLRERFPTAVEATTAGFLTGKMHYDQGRFGAAARELGAYLEAAPGGAFAGEAQVLRILALHQGGQAGEARQLAQRYLKQHPQSPHANRLREIAGHGSAP